MLKVVTAVSLSRLQCFYTMRDEMDQFLKGWKVRSIEVLPEKQGVEVIFQVEGHDPVRFRTRKFGIGRRGAKSAALAKFAAQAGYGSLEDVFTYVSGLPSDMVGGSRSKAVPWSWRPARFPTG